VRCSRPLAAFEPQSESDRSARCGESLGNYFAFVTRQGLGEDGPGRRGSSGKWCRVYHPATNPTTLTDGVMGAGWSGAQCWE
jgi:hypothetical protein